MTDGPKTLEIFDFDWTLFRSPPPPEGFPRKKFLHNPVSLEPPYVPKRPGSEYWIEEVVRELLVAQRRREFVTAIITARRARTEERIEELLQQRRIDPDFLCLRAVSFQKDKNKVYFKRKCALEILSDYPTVGRIIVWEDDQEQLDSLKDLARRRKLAFEGNLVTEPKGLHR